MEATSLFCHSESFCATVQVKQVILMRQLELAHVLLLHVLLLHVFQVIGISDTYIRFPHCENFCMS